MLAPEIRIVRSLYEGVVSDLKRAHPFAGERVGFMFGKFVPSQTERPLILLTRYSKVEDMNYVESEEYEAMIGQESILDVMQTLRSARGTGECAFHVHLHAHKGEPGFSKPDTRGLPKLIPGFQRMSPDGCHGLLLLSLNHAIANIWIPGETEAVQSHQVAIVGGSISLFIPRRVKR